MSKLLFAASTAQSIKRTTWEDQDYLIVPVVAIVAGVLNSELVPVAELERFHAAWNGAPVTLDHPEIDGVHVSANRPDLLSKYSIGRFFNVTFDRDRLKGEAWIDISKASRTDDGHELVRRALAGDPIEVSTAYHRELEPAAGIERGQPYKGIARELRPDHLAMLLHDQGACSWQDGCGAPRVNQDDAQPGGPEMCVCPECGYGTEKERGTPCRSMTCPKCGATLIAGGEVMEANILSKARKPSYSGTEEISWADVGKGFADYRDGYYKHSGADKPDDLPSSVGDAPQAMKTWIASKTLLGDSGAGDVRDLIFFPVVNPSTDKLNAGAVRAVLGGRAAQADIPDAAKESAQAMARSLLEDEFATESAINKIVSALKSLPPLRPFWPLKVNEESLDDRAWRIREAFSDTFPMPDYAEPARLYVERVFEDFVIVSDDQGNLFQYPYTEDDEGSVEFGEPVAVQMTYEPIAAQGQKPAQKEVRRMDQELVNAVAGKLSMDVSELSDVPEPVLEAVNALELETPCAESAALIEYATGHGGPEAALQTLKEIHESAQTRHTELVDKLAGVEGIAFSKENLQSFDLDTLSRLDAFLAHASKPANYSGTPAQQEPKGERVHTLPPMSP